MIRIISNLYDHHYLITKCLLEVISRYDLDTDELYTVTGLGHDMDWFTFRYQGEMIRVDTERVVCSRNGKTILVGLSPISCTGKFYFD